MEERLTWLGCAARVRAGSSPTPAGAGEVLRAGPQHRGRCWKSKREKASGEPRSAGPALPARGPSWGPELGARGTPGLGAPPAGCPGRSDRQQLHGAAGSRTPPRTRTQGPPAPRPPVSRGPAQTAGRPRLPRAIVGPQGHRGLQFALGRPPAVAAKGAAAAQATGPEPPPPSPGDPLRPPPRPHALPGCGARRSGAPYLS